MHLLEDCEVKSKRLKEEGNILAEEERYWEAIQRWDEAIQLTPGNAVLYELKSQALLILNELYPAVASAQKAVDLDPCWAVAQQTLGRAQLGLGEVRMALRSFEKAVHLDPLNTEVWEEDLPWARELLLKKGELEQMKDENHQAVNENYNENGCHSTSHANVNPASNEESN
jgi:tetratricopeptide (TPR) repeat protein